MTFPLGWESPTPERVAGKFTFDELIAAVWMTVASEGYVSLHTLRFALVIDSDTEEEKRLHKALLALQKLKVITLEEGEYVLHWVEPETSFEGL